MNIAIFEDAAVEKLAPITTSKPAYAISCGGFRLIDFIELFAANTMATVRNHLTLIQDQKFNFGSTLDLSRPKTLILNARIAPTVTNYQTLKQLLAQSACIIRDGNNSIAAALVPTETLPEDDWLNNVTAILNAADLPPNDAALDMFQYPHDVISLHMQHTQQNLEFRLLQDQFDRLAEGVFTAKQYPPTIHPSAVFDASGGPIIFDSNVTVGPHCFFRGPVYIGPNGKISEHSSIKDAVTVAHTCKIGGEVEGCIFEPYTNKQHHGFLGHSYLGSWINLGAGTCNSDLKNTYGKINMTYGDQTIATGMQFVGCIIGDYAKTSINTSIFTGKTIGVASMVYGLATANVPSFVNYARTLGQLGLLPPEIAISTQKRMFARRNVAHLAADSQLIEDMFLLTQHERPSGLSAQPIAF